MTNETTTVTQNLIATCCRVTMIALILAVVAGGAYSQNTTSNPLDGYTPTALAPGSPAGSYALSGFDTVNPYSGGMSFNLPLLSVGGRGGAGYTIQLAIEQKWTINHSVAGSFNFYEPEFNTFIASTRAGYGPGTLFGRQAGSNYTYCDSTDSFLPTKTLTRFTFATPDGTEFELRDVKTDGQPFSVGICALNGTSRGKVFKTADGSSATFISDQQVVDEIFISTGIIGASGYLFLRDGTRYRIDGGTVTWMTDRNGNKLTFEYNNTARVSSIKDSLNREVTIEYNVQDDAPYGLCDRIRYKGFNGTARVIRISYDGLANLLRSDSSVQNCSALFPALNNASSSNSCGGGSLVSAVWLPDRPDHSDRRSYKFQYNSYSELARVDLPTGGSFEYDWSGGYKDGPASGAVCFECSIYRRVTERRVYPNGGQNWDSRMTFSKPDSVSGAAQADNFVEVDQYDSAGTLKTAARHYYFGHAGGSVQANDPVGYPDWQEGKEYQTESLTTNASPALRQVLRRTVSVWDVTPPTRQFGPASNPRVIETDTTLEPSGVNLTAKQTFAYDQYNNKTDIYEYDYGSASPLRHSHTDYVTTNSVNSIAYDTVNPNTLSPDVNATIHLRSLPIQESIYDARGVEQARTRFEYDKYSGDTNHAAIQTYPRPSFSELPISGLDASFTSNSSHLARGNVTAVTRYLLDGSGNPASSIAAYSQYDVAGNVVKIIDPRSTPTNVIASSFDFSDRFGSPDAEAQSNTVPAELSTAVQSTYAFATKLSNALGHTAYTQVDYYLGRPVNAEEPNGIVSSASYDDPLDRPKQLIRAVNGTADVKSQTTFNYNDVDRIVTITSDQSGYLDNLLKSEIVYDGLGRTSEKRQYENASSFIAVRQFYDKLGRGSQTSNPFRPGETIRWTTTAYDDLSRVISVTTPDNAVVKTAYSGNRVLVADQNESDELRRKRISKTDALGRLKDVWEITGVDGATEAVSFPDWPSVTAGYHTTYEYNTLDDLTFVHQGNQTRSFLYDSLKRLSSATNPESATIRYQYDEDGNLRVKTDARGVSAHVSYDAVGRVVRRWYNGSSAQTDLANNVPILPAGVSPSDEVAYSYDSQTLLQTAPPNFSRGFAIGRLVAVTYGTGSSAGDYYGYDAAGRAGLKIQQISGTIYKVEGTYNLAGEMTSQTYPTGHIVNYGYDRVGRTNSVVGTLGDSGSRTYATGISYSPFGGITQEQFGTQTALYHKLHYNTRGQQYDNAVSTSSLQVNEFNWNRGHLALYYGYAFGESGPANNGNISRAQHWIPTNDAISDYSYIQDTYNYDSINRLSSATEFQAGSDWITPPSYAQNYDYDRWGNRTINPGSTGAINRAQFDKADAQNSNRLYAPGDTPVQMNQRRMQYDPAGNLTYDSYTGQGARLYDGENRMTAAQDLNESWSNYTYDGDGRRVKRTTNGVETRQVYGLGNELLAEYALSDLAWKMQKEYGYRNGQLLITAAAPQPRSYLASNTPTPPISAQTDAGRDLLARLKDARLPSWITNLAMSTGNLDPISDSSTPLYGPWFPYASLNTSVLPVTPQSGSAKIAFTSNRDGTAQIYVMNTDGSGVARLTNDIANDESPKWSPNNSRIVFQSDRDNLFTGLADIYMMNWDGSNQTRLTSDINDDSAPVWSPDGNKIAFQSARNGVSYQVYVMNADGSGQLNISNDAANDTQPSWSPDGTKIAFASDRDHSGFSNLYVMNTNGTSQTRLTFTGIGFRDEQPAWSPDSSKIGFTSSRDSTTVTWTETDDDGNAITKSAVNINKEVYVMNASGSNSVRLTNTLENDDSPTWSIDGTQIAFRSDRERECCDPTNQVWVMSADGSNPLDLSNNGFGDYTPNCQRSQTAIPPPPNRAEFVWQSVPTAMEAGHTYNVAVQMRNTGSNTWTTPAHYNLGSQNAQDNATWSMARVSIPSSVAPGTTVTYNFTVTAPSTPGTYNFQWRTVQDFVEWFGDLSPNVAVTVNPSNMEYTLPLADVRWIVADQLGTPRMIFDESGSLANVSRHDYLPYGEELAGIGGRTTGRGYTGNDLTRQKFTSKERDNETGLDFFESRYYASPEGRFTSTDPVAMAVDRLADPQRINLYAYARNNPINLIDPSGETIGYADKDAQKAYDDYVAFLNKDPKKYGKELATIERLTKSKVNYVIALGTKGFKGDAEGKTEPDNEGNIIVGIRNIGGSQGEKFDLHGRFAHELEHGRQFDAGELTFFRNLKTGEWFGYPSTYDVMDEVNAFKAQIDVSPPVKDTALLGSLRDNRQSDEDRAQRLISGPYPHLKNSGRNNNYTPFESSGRKPGEIVRTSQFYGVVHSLIKDPPK
jgi:RHS repeat-associated protein